MPRIRITLFSSSGKYKYDGHADVTVPLHCREALNREIRCTQTAVTQKAWDGNTWYLATDYEGPEDAFYTALFRVLDGRLTSPP